MVRLALALLVTFGAWSVFGLFGFPDAQYGVAFGVALTLRLSIAIVLGVVAWKELGD